MTGPDPLAALLAAKPVVVADGAMGTNLFARGLETGESPELWNIDHPDRVARLHSESIKFILDRDIQGDGGPVGKQMQAKLRGLMESAD